MVYTVCVKVVRERERERERESQCKLLSACLSCCCFFHMSSTLLLEVFADDCANISNLFFLNSRLFEISAIYQKLSLVKNVPCMHIMAMYTSKC